MRRTRLLLVASVSTFSFCAPARAVPLDAVMKDCEQKTIVMGRAEDGKMVKVGERISGYGIAQSEMLPDALAGNRANLEYRRRWAEPQDPQVFDVIASQFRERGLVSTRGAHGLVLEVPLDGGSPSRMFDPKAETALLKVSTDVPHPLAGVGYAATIALPYDPASADVPSWCSLLNDAEHAMQDFVPRLGAWGMRSLDRELVYSLFWPTDRSDAGLPKTIMNWLVTRVRWLQQRYWEPGIGLVRRGGTHA